MLKKLGNKKIFNLVRWINKEINFKAKMIKYK